MEQEFLRIPKAPLKINWIAGDPCHAGLCPGKIAFSGSIYQSAWVAPWGDHRFPRRYGGSSCLIHPLRRG